MATRIAFGLLFLSLAVPELSFGEDATHSSILRLQQFIEDPNLTAQPGQMVILDGPATDADQAAIRYQLPTGNHEFCLDGNQRYFSGIVLEDAFGQEILRHESGPKCTKADVPAGMYTVRISHNKSAVPKPNGLAQVTVDPPNPTLVDNTGDAIGGYWAVQPDPSNDNQNLGDGRLTTNPSFAPFGSYSPFDRFLGSRFPTYANVIQEEFGVTQMDQYSLFRFQYGNSSNLAAYYPANNYLNRVLGHSGGSLGVSTCTCQNNVCPIDNSGLEPRFDAQPFCPPTQNSATLVVQDLGHYQFKLQYRDLDGTLDYQIPEYGHCLVFDDSNNTCTVLLDTNFQAELNDYPQQTGPLHVVFRFFPDGKVPPLQEGEVALYEQCNYQGKAVVLGRPLANFLEWTSDILTLDKLGASVQLGNNTAVTFYSDLNFTGSSQTETLDAACLASPPKMASIQLQSLEAVLVSTGKCPNCRLEGVDFSGVDLTGVDLTSAHMKGAVLAGTVLSNATLRLTDLSGAKLYGATVNNANLEGANLSGAFLTRPPAGGAAASLEGAFLRNVNLSQAQLSGADLTNASFYSTTAAGTGICTPDPNTGFTNNCATAASAVMNNTQFGGAYLFGVDFTGAQIQGVQFTNAVLTGANFNKAKVSVDSSIGTNSGFSAAFLQGTNLATAESLSGVSLANAYVDFSPQGNTMYLILGGQHTLFPGYWNTPGQPVCAEMSYNGPPDPQQALVPTNNPTITCPDGNIYPAGCGSASPDGTNTHWKSPVDISQIASYQFDATFTKAPASPICAYDPKWIPIVTARPGKPRRPKPRPVQTVLHDTNVEPRRDIEP